MLNNINNSHGLIFLYSQFRIGEGIEIFSKMAANGYKQYNSEVTKKLPFNLFDIGKW